MVLDEFLLDIIFESSLPLSVRVFMEKTIQRVIEAPAIVLDKTVDTSIQITKKIFPHREFKKAHEYWKMLGPGLTTGAADDDPSGIATYSQAGAQYGTQLLWLAPFTFPLMAIVQEMCARIGLVTGRGLAGNIRLYYPRWVLYTCTILLFLANTLNLGADLGAMAKATQLLAPTANYSYLIVGFAVVTLGVQIFTTYEKYAKYLKFLALILLSYVFSGLIVITNWHEVLKNIVIPTVIFSKDQIILICGILGTTISPYLFFWQTSQEVEEAILQGKTTIRLRQGTNHQELAEMRIDVWSGMFFSNLVMFFIIAACAATLHTVGIFSINTAAEAATALRPIAGEQAYLMFALGIIGTGFLAVPVLAGSASYALSESFRWKTGLYRKLKEAPSFYGVIILSTAIGLAINFMNIHPIKALIYSAIGNGLVAPIVLFLIVRISSNKKLMGEWTNPLSIRIIGWGVTLTMMIASVATIVFLLQEFL